MLAIQYHTNNMKLKSKILSAEETIWLGLALEQSSKWADIMTKKVNRIDAKDNQGDRVAKLEEELAYIKKKN